MFKTIKIILITLILFLFTFNYVQAMDINMNLSDNTNSYPSSSTITDDYSVSLSSMPENNLGFRKYFKYYINCCWIPFNFTWNCNYD